MNAYDEMYVDDAMKNLGEAFDYAANACGLGLDEFMALFVTSGMADQFGKGNPKLVSGLSGTELVMTVLDETGYVMDRPEAQAEYDYSEEYWAGWILAYYQWKSGRTFRDIHRKIAMTDLLKRYPTLHEASEDKASEVFDGIMLRESGASKLQQLRRLCGYSQRELSERSGVNLRTLQQYEARYKDISKASVQTVAALARVLGCGIEDITDIFA